MKAWKELVSLILNNIEFFNNINIPLLFVISSIFYLIIPYISTNFFGWFCISLFFIICYSTLCDFYSKYKYKSSEKTKLAVKLKKEADVLKNKVDYITELKTKNYNSYELLVYLMVREIKHKNFILVNYDPPKDFWLMVDSNIFFEVHHNKFKIYPDWYYFLRDYIEETEDLTWVESPIESSQTHSIYMFPNENPTEDNNSCEDDK